MERNLTTGSKRAGFAAALCCVAYCSPLSCPWHEVPGVRGDCPSEGVCTALHPHDPPRSPPRSPQGAVKVAHPAGSEVPPRESQCTAIDKVPQLQGKESICFCLPEVQLVSSPGHRLDRTLFSHFT